MAESLVTSTPSRAGAANPLRVFRPTSADLTRDLTHLFSISRDGLGSYDATSKTGAGPSPQGKAEGPSDFVKTFLLYALSGELLRYSIEDDAVDIRPLTEEIVRTVNQFIKGDFEKGLFGLEAVLRKLSLATPVPTGDSNIVATTNHEELHFKVKFARSNNLIPVSSSYHKYIPILEDNLADPKLVTRIIDVYTRNIIELKETHGISYLCFVEKPAGPVGALPLLASLVDRVGLPAFIYRENCWLPRAQLAGSIPSPDAKILIVYDLVVTGTGIRDTIQELRRLHGLRVAAALVLFAYGNAQESVTDDGKRIPIRTLLRQGDIDTLFSKSQEATSRSAAALPVARGVVHAPISEETSVDDHPPSARRTDIRSSIRKTIEFFDNAPKARIEELVRHTRDRLVEEGEGDSPELEAWPKLPPRKKRRK
jgi:hypothetical protein